MPDVAAADSVQSSGTAPGDGFRSTSIPLEIEFLDSTPYSAKYRDVYFSRDNGLAETRHVFLSGNQLPDRWAGRQNFTIAETGFGTGLNFLAAWQCWRRNAPADARLHYVSVEKHPFEAASLESCHALFPELDPLSRQLRLAWPGTLPGFHRCLLDEGRVRLTLCHGDAADSLRELVAEVDCWYLDGFAPTRNPDMWSERVLREIGRLSHPGTTFATFTVAGRVRRGLAAQGFRVWKAPGHGRKREMMAGVMETVPAYRQREPWFRPPRMKVAGHAAVVIGAGIAGAQTALQLASRGWSVTVLERHGNPSMEASGSPVAVFSPHLTARSSLEERYSMQSFVFLLHHLCALDPGRGFHDRCGVLELSINDARRQRAGRIASRTLPAWLVRPASREQANAISSVECGIPGLFYPTAGLVNPREWIRRLLSHPNIEVRCGRTVRGIGHDDSGWQALDGDGAVVGAAPVLVFASGQSMDWPQTCWLPLTPVSGQSSYIDAGMLQGQPDCVIRHDGYLLPGTDGPHTIGATYRRGHNGADADPAADEENLANLERALPGLLASPGTAGRPVYTAHSAVRMSSENRLPLVGALPDPVCLAREYPRMLRRNYQPPATDPAYPPGLHISAAWGSRGMTNAALGGEFLASLICGEPLPLEASLVHAIHPARSLVRALKQGSRCPVSVFRNQQEFGKF